MSTVVLPTSTNNLGKKTKGSECENTTTSSLPLVSSVCFFFEKQKNNSARKRTNNKKYPCSCCFLFLCCLINATQFLLHSLHLNPTLHHGTMARNRKNH
eukprot:m.185701 g.185701  ORF g.185701 m.185701 type:complete len:99 (+) comp32239_c0_seq5:3304-3600(+)